MNLPGFSADASIGGRAVYGVRRLVRRRAATGVVPARPACSNCDAILDRCAETGGKPRAVCNACATGNCYSGEENPGGHCWYDGLRNKVVCDL